MQCVRRRAFTRYHNGTRPNLYLWRTPLLNRPPTFLSSMLSHSPFKYSSTLHLFPLILINPEIKNSQKSENQNEHEDHLSLIHFPHHCNLLYSRDPTRFFWTIFRRPQSLPQQSKTARRRRQRWWVRRDVRPG